jgi:hypothetical protein
MSNVVNIENLTNFRFYIRALAIKLDTISALILLLRN